MHGQTPAAAQGFIARHGLWSDDQSRLARELAVRVGTEDLHLIRLVWADTHGVARARSLAPAAFESALVDGHSVGAGTWSLDASGGRVFTSFVAGGGMNLPEMTGSPNLVMVPDPGTFRVLPWAPGVGWVACDEYFRDGRPFHFSPRHLLRRQLARLAGHGLRAVVGLEVEWYLLRLLETELSDEHIGAPGVRGRPPRTAAPEPGFSYDAESTLDRMQPMLSRLAQDYVSLGLALRSMDNEFGAGQVECTFMPQDAMAAATDFVLFRSATRQICRRHGHLASFMTFPGLKGLFPSGWHLHLSLVDAGTGVNRLTPGRHDEHLSPLGMNFLAGQLEHAASGLPFATPTINGYRRFRVNSLAPDRATWNADHRGVMLRIQGGPGDPATRIENRVGEPAANPYLFIAAQIAAGLDGVSRRAQPGPPDDDPYQADRPMLPTRLADALAALEASPLYREAFGERYLTYFLRMKRAELARFEATLGETGVDPAAGVTGWEMNEYFDAF
ncbi:MAG: glutamine synthetase family protein [Burkholderiaceae bacterium]